MGMCQQKLAMLFLIQNELGASLAEGNVDYVHTLVRPKRTRNAAQSSKLSPGRELQQSARVLRAAHDVFQSMKRVPYHATRPH